MPGLHQAEECRRRAQRPRAGNVLKRPVLGVQRRMLGARRPGALAQQARNGRARGSVPENSTQRILVARGREAHCPPLLVHFSAAFWQRLDLRCKGHQHLVEVSEVVLRSWTYGSQDGVFWVVRVRLIDERDDKLGRGQR